MSWKGTFFITVSTTIPLSIYFFLFPPSLIMLDAKVELRHVVSMCISLPFFLWVKWVQEGHSVPGQRETEALSGPDNPTNPPAWTSSGSSQVARP